MMSGTREGRSKYVNPKNAPWRHWHVTDRRIVGRQGSHTDATLVLKTMDRGEAYDFANRYEDQQPVGRRTDVKSCMDSGCLEKTDGVWTVPDDGE